MSEPVPVAPRRVRFGDVMAGAMLGLVLPGVVMVAWMLGLHALGASISVVFCGIVVLGVLGVGLLSWWLRRQGLSRTAIGFVSPTRSLWHLLWVTPTLIAGSATVAAVLGNIAGDMDSPAGSRSNNLDLSLPATMLVAVASCVLIPLIEEVIFRGLLFTWLGQRFGTAATVIIAGVVFGLCHVEPTIMLYVIPLGIGLTTVRAWFGSVWASFTVHLCNNALVSTLALIALT